MVLEPYGSFMSEPSYEGFDKVTAAFGIIGRESSLRPNIGKPRVLVKQRNGDGEFPWMFDLPGGAADPEDASIEQTLERELLEEVGVRASYFFRIGRPMWEVREQERKIVEYHLFYALPFGPPRESVEAVNLAWVNPMSVLALKIAGLDVETKAMSPMGVMIFDGFSVIGEPFYVGPLTPEIANSADALHPKSYSLLDHGRYFGRLDKDGEVKLFRRLNPFEPKGYFAGSFEHLGPQG
jgi:8-oxo-dGTP pyrophosphatase MutT (NUDIX family)